MAGRSFEDLRNEMVDLQLAGRGITDKKVLETFRMMPRHEFVPKSYENNAYDDYPLPTGDGQTISQPYIAALMTECLGLKGGERILEIGTGSGYQTAILAEMAPEVYSVERFPALAEKAKTVLDKLGYKNCKIRVGDGTLGWSEYAPYDGILVTAGAPGIPESLVKQLKDGGRLVIPVGRGSQILTVAEKRGDSLRATEVCGCVFVPLVGEEGWKNSELDL